MRTTLKPKKCRECGVIFAPARSMQKVCSPVCAIALTEKDKARKVARAQRAERKSLREALEKAKTRGTHLRELQAVFNRWIRARDAALPCISCDRPATWDGQWHASHFKSVGHAPALRFEPLNVHKACSVCNRHLGGNYAGYKPRLIVKIGEDKVDWLEGPHGPLKITIPEIQELKAFYRAELRKIANNHTETR
ncbi:recombination protein NinG [Burkholderia cenocepacia]|uniref:recombination protein NinG n=1 Tax=Burkholderia cenocepacia TaxID=95486 RepID=UPI0020129E2D|nr:recombination protein NinG [Burkholderia cenocepacia]